MGHHPSDPHADQLQAARLYWDQFAAVFDDEADHGLRDPLVREAWSNFLQTLLPSGAAAVLDIGCGTGSLSVLLAGLGHRVTAIDLSPAMIALAQAKAMQAGLAIEFMTMDAGDPHLPGRRFDVVLCRHLLWTLPEPQQVLHRWSSLLHPAGRFILIEGFWHTAAGLHAAEVVRYLPPGFTSATVHNLSDQPNFWGKSVSDERYAVTAELLSPSET